MDQIKNYSTASAAKAARLAYWNDLLQELFLPLEVTADNSIGFEAAMLFGRVGPGIVAETWSTPASVNHTLSHVARTGERLFSLMVSLEGAVNLSHYGRDIELRTGDFTLYDSHAPCRISFDENNHALTLRIDPATLALFIPSPERFCAVRMAGDRGLGKLLGVTLTEIWKQAKHGLSDLHGQPLAKSILQIAGAHYSMAFGTTTDEAALNTSRKIQIKRFVEANLNDPSLSITRIAKALGVSVRYVHRMLEKETETLSTYILRRRLEEAASTLLNPLWRHYTITDVAFHWGFGSIPHFTRSFKKHFECTPGEYRQRTVAMSSLRESTKH